MKRYIDLTLKRLKKRGAKLQRSPDQSDYTIVFCPIVSRFETDIQAALSTVPGSRNVILVAMHHTYDPNYTLPDKRSCDNTAVKLLVEFLFFEKKGLLKCPRNSKAKKAIWKEVISKTAPLWRYQHATYVLLLACCCQIHSTLLFSSPVAS
uniref:Uncharacterized protein n=1 Tax=Xiphophorus couchianus TaxID=32473 RepID=A0A3B5KXZ7_9TELE